MCVYNCYLCYKNYKGTFWRVVWYSSLRRWEQRLHYRTLKSFYGLQKRSETKQKDWNSKYTNSTSWKFICDIDLTCVLWSLSWWIHASLSTMKFVTLYDFWSAAKNSYVGLLFFLSFWLFTLGVVDIEQIPSTLNRKPCHELVNVCRLFWTHSRKNFESPKCRHISHRVKRYFVSEWSPVQKPNFINKTKRNKHSKYNRIKTVSIQTILW